MERLLLFDSLKKSKLAKRSGYAIIYIYQWKGVVFNGKNVDG